ncbi:Methyltransferase type 12 [Penicillium daleae]|uniref:Methyltransferase type 12 n=1 Tax=Penicillium daleae TaxID=63821 RepID=A0AAD6G5U9_9EURO|nr:Methyltransferase type 12 [Penicillium daleae]KAJ5460839.1 Methyltransferase type 12 [Penicillium daleae]
MGSHASDDKIYLLGRDEAETERLNKQHRFLLAISGDELMHPSIPRDQISAVADLGTGTGIWLEDFAQKHPNPSSLDLHGFDISPAQFPTGHEIVVPEKTRIALSVHDALQPYPAEHLGRYDLVHIRLLTAGLKQGDYTVVLKNARDLLKPTGYLQWEEVDTTTFCTNGHPELPAITTMRNTVIDAMLKLNLWPFAPPTVYEEIRTGGFNNVHRETYTTEGKEHLYAIAPKWVTGVMRALVPQSMVVLGQAGSEEEAKGKTEGLIGEFEEHCRRALALASFGVSVGQRGD